MRTIGQPLVRLFQAQKNNTIVVFLRLVCCTRKVKDAKKTTMVAGDGQESPNSALHKRSSCFPPIAEYLTLPGMNLYCRWIFRRHRRLRRLRFAEMQLEIRGLRVVYEVLPMHYAEQR
jgi:hypothetical protein